MGPDNEYNPILVSGCGVGTAGAPPRIRPTLDMSDVTNWAVVHPNGTLVYVTENELDKILNDNTRDTSSVLDSIVTSSAIYSDIYNEDCAEEKDDKNKKPFYSTLPRYNKRKRKTK